MKVSVTNHLFPVLVTSIALSLSRYRVDIKFILLSEVYDTTTILSTPNRKSMPKLLERTQGQKDITDGTRLGLVGDQVEQLLR